MNPVPDLWFGNNSYNDQTPICNRIITLCQSSKLTISLCLVRIFVPRGVHPKTKFQLA